MQMGYSDIEVRHIGVIMGGGCGSGGSRGVLCHVFEGRNLIICSVTRMGRGRVELLVEGVGVVNGEMARSLSGMGMGAVNALVDVVTFQQVMFGDARALELMHIGCMRASADAAHDEGSWA